MSDRKHMDIAEFRDLGILQEVNRQMLHPLGLALERRFHLQPIGINHRAERRDRDAEIYRRWDAGESQAALAREFGLSGTRLGGIVSTQIRKDPEAWERERARHPGNGRLPRAKLS